MILYKSIAAHKVLELMDNDISYQQALKQVLEQDETIDQIELEKELDLYV